MSDPLVFKDFQTAVADSPHLGHALMRNIDIESFPGALKSQRKLLSMTNLINSRTVSTNVGGSPPDLFTSSNGGFNTQANTDDGRVYEAVAVTFTTTGTLPSVDFTGGGGSPLTVGTVYFAIRYDDTNFRIANTLANAKAGTWGSVTANGSGVHTVTAVPVGTIRSIVRDIATNGYYYMYDSNGRVWHTRGGTVLYLLTGNTLTGGEGQGLAIFKTSDASKTYLFVFRNAFIDIVDVTSDSTLNAPSWTTAWKTLNSGSGSGNSHFAKVGQDNIIYYCDDRYIGSIMENAGSVFDPSNSATYTWSQKALTLPNGELAYCLEELGVNLLVGGRTYNKIYPWDRVSASFTLPIQVPEYGIYRMINAGSTVYILAGVKGNIYKTQGTYAQIHRQVPGYVANNSSTLPYSVQWGGMAFRSGAILAGFGAATSGNSGVYIIYTDGKVLQDNTPYGGSQIATAVYSENDTYVIGYANGADYASSSRASAGTFVSVYQSELVRVADKTHKEKFSQTEVKIAKVTASGQIRISYRRDTTSSWTTIVTFTMDNASTSFQTDFGIIDVENIQIQVEFDSNIEIMQVTLTP